MKATEWALLSCDAVYHALYLLKEKKFRLQIFNIW